MEVKIKNFDENVDINKISNFLFRVQKNSGYLGKDTTLKSIRKELKDLRKNYKFILFEGYENSQLIGLLLLFTNTPKFGLIWDWHPFVLPDVNKNKNAVALIKECIAFAEENDISRIEVCFGIQSEVSRKRYHEYFNLYNSLDFYHVIEEAEMELNLKEKKNKKITFPENLETKPITNIKFSDLIGSSFEIMNKSEDNMFLDLNEKEKLEVIKNYFEPSEQIIQDASFILTKGNKIIGYSIAKSSRFGMKKAIIASFGIKPNFRNQGLGEALIVRSLKELINKNFEMVNLDVALENEPAYKLYSKVGFKKISSTNILAFNC